MQRIFQVVCLAGKETHFQTAKVVYSRRQMREKERTVFHCAQELSIVEYVIIPGVVVVTAALKKIHECRVVSGLRHFTQYRIFDSQMRTRRKDGEKRCNAAKSQ